MDPSADKGGDGSLCLGSAYARVGTFLPSRGNCTANVAGELGAFSCALG